MSRVEDFRCELTQPDVFREQVATLAAVARSCCLSYANGTRLELVASAAGPSMQVWVHFTHGSMLGAPQLFGDAQHVEVKSDSLANAFRNLSDVLNVEDVQMTLSHKSESAGARLISITMENVGALTKTIEQRLYGQLLADEHVPLEPHVEPTVFVDIDTSQRMQMARVCDQYKQMNNRIAISLAPSGVLTLVCSDADVLAETSWRVEFAERLTQPAEAQTEICEAAVLARDWLLVVQSRVCRRLVVGIAHQGGVVAYAFLKHLKSSSEEDIATYYLWHRGE